jgi:predicted ATPase/DNA-binding CsgD family transcriptional regulator
MGTPGSSLHQVEAHPKGLPQHLTKFVGRDAELRSLKSLLRDARLVTITGTGGAGKTRLAAELARFGLDHWPDGVWWIELAGADDVVGTLIATAELPGLGRPIDVATSWLAMRHALLVLDNCEHLIAASAAFCQATLERCPHVTILATSREPLGIPGEARWPLSALTGGDALRLFEARALLVRPGFSAKTHADTIARICDRLDRLPLAIEMASARLDMMSERELLENLNESFRVLASAARTVPERQQTMTAAIEWSYRLLTEEEARLFRRLAVFQGGFTMQAAQAVCAAALPLLSGLVRKSMVVADGLDDRSTRYRLMESHRDYAQEKLSASGEVDDLQRRHYEYFLSQTWKARESANFWAALAWARDHLNDAGLALAVELAESEFSDQARMLNLLMERLGRAPELDSVRARGLNIAARLASRRADHDTGRALADESLALARELGDPELIANMLRGAGAVYHAGGQPDVSRRMYDEALALLKKSADRRLAVSVQNQIGLIANEQGDFATALEILGECVAFSRSNGDMGALEQYLESLANAQLGTDDVDGAAASWTEALSICRDRDDPFGMIWSLGGLALVAALRDEDERALRLAAVVERLSREFSFTAWSFRVNRLHDISERIRKKLGPRRSEQIWSQGMAMNTAAALEYAAGGKTPSTEEADRGPLSRRELEVAAMVAGGMTNKEIAQRLFIAERTAEGHVERIRNKLGVRSRTEVATWAVGRGLGTRQP